MKTDFVVDAYMRAIFIHRPAKGLIVHFDRGSQPESAGGRLVEHGFPLPRLND